ncbi:hypothetical protein WA158_000561 [Blastocystis sp. Blastoise]
MQRQFNEQEMCSDDINSVNGSSVIRDETSDTMRSSESPSSSNNALEEKETIDSIWTYLYISVLTNSDDTQLENTKYSWCIPILRAYIEGRPIDFSPYEYKELLDILNMLEFMNLPLPPELIACRNRRDKKETLFKKGDECRFLVNGNPKHPFIYLLKAFHIYDVIINLFDNKMVGYDSDRDIAVIDLDYNLDRNQYKIANTLDSTGVFIYSVNGKQLTSDMLVLLVD